MRRFPDKSVIVAIRDLADGLDAKKFEVLSCGIGVGELKPLVARKEPQAEPKVAGGGPAKPQQGSVKASDAAASRVVPPRPSENLKRNLGTHHQGVKSASGEAKMSLGGQDSPQKRSQTVALEGQLDGRSEPTSTPRNGDFVRYSELGAETRRSSAIPTGPKVNRARKKTAPLASSLWSSCLSFVQKLDRIVRASMNPLQQFMKRFKRGIAGFPKPIQSSQSREASNQDRLKSSQRALLKAALEELQGYGANPGEKSEGSKRDMQRPLPVAPSKPDYYRNRSVAHRQLSLRKKMVRYFLVYSADFAFVTSTIIVVFLLAGFWLDRAHASLDINTVHEWLPVKVVQATSLAKIGLFVYLSYAAYLGFFRIFIGKTFGSILFPDMSRKKI